MKFFLLFISIIFLQFAIAQPITKTNADAALQEMIDTERAFARTSVQKNTREAFLNFSADDGIILRKGKIINAKQDWNKQKADSSELYWYPEVADMSAAGDMGFTSGPWQYKLKRGDQQPVAFGHFTTVWKKQADGTWKTVIDLGISHARPSEQDNENHVTLPAFRSTAVSGKSIDALKASMLDAEKDFIKLQTGIGRAAYEKYMMPGIRVYRNNQFPYQPEKFIVVSSTPPLSFELIAGDIASSGDIGYVYGNSLLANTPGNYMRVWKRDKNGDWKIVLDVIGE